MGLNLKALIGKLNEPARLALEGAAGLCLSRTNYDVEVEHYLTKLLDSASGDFAAIIKHFEIDKSRLTADLARSIDKLKSGNARTPAISPTVLKMLTTAWTIGSIDFNAGQVRTGFTIIALVSDDELTRLVNDVSREFQKINADALRKDLLGIVALSSETTTTATAGAAPGDAGAKPAGGKTPNLDSYTVDLTGNARKGKIDPVLGRDAEIRQLVDILTRRRQNNPILTGEAGVGKTAVVEGFALRVAQGDVPPPLKNVHVRTLDLALLQAGAGVKGEFENRLKGLIEEVKASATPIILFIDEAHTMIGAGGQAGQNDAANLLKPALARGELRTIAATTWSEYKKYFEKDAALARRFQVVKVEEPSEHQCLIMMRGLVASLEKHHNVRILDEAVYASVRLSHRFLAGRQLPDKAVSILDTACARLSLGQNATPPALEDTTRQIDALEVQKRILERETVVGADHQEKLGEIEEQKTAATTKLKALQERWDKERELVTKIRALREKLEAGHAANGTVDAAAATSAGNAWRNAVSSTVSPSRNSRNRVRCAGARRATIRRSASYFGNPVELGRSSRDIRWSSSGYMDRSKWSRTTASAALSIRIGSAGRVHRPAQAQRAHVHPHLVDVREALRPGSGEPVGVRGGRIVAAQPMNLLQRHAERSGWVTQDAGLRSDFVPWVLTASCCFRRSVLEQLGGFDETLRSGEDTDLCYRMQLRLNLSVAYVPAAVAEHVHRTNVRGVWRQWVRYGWGGVQLEARFPGRPEAPRTSRHSALARLLASVGRGLLLLPLVPLGRADPLDAVAPLLRVVEVTAALVGGRQARRASGRKVSA